MKTALPHSKEQEIAVLGAMMIDSVALTIALGIVEDESFYIEKNKLIFKAIKNVFNDGKNVDVFSVSEEIKKIDSHNIVKFDYLSEIVLAVPTAAGIMNNAHLVQEYYIKRKLIEDATKTINEAYSPETDAIALLDKQQNKIDELQNLNVNQIITPAKQPEIVISNYEFYNADNVRFPRSGIYSFDKFFSPFLPGQFVVIAARPSIGKTSLALTFAKNISSQNIPVAFLSLEMSAYELLVKLMSIETDTNSENFHDKSKKPETQIAVRYFCELLPKSKIYIDDTPSLNEISLFAKLKKMVKLYSIQVAFIDYIGLMDCSVNKKNRAEEISHISRKIKMIAKKLSITIFGLVQINREAEKGKFPTPALHHIRDSGSIEQDADTVILIDRPEFYGYDTFEDKETCKRKARLIVAKRRAGKTGIATVGFNYNTTEFYELNTTQVTNNDEPYWEDVPYLTDDDVDQF